jgi:DnaD/phage-associated family protein
MSELTPFPGFEANIGANARLPDPFFSELLPIIDDLAELKLTLYCFWVLQQREGAYRYIRRHDMIEDEIFLRGLADNPAEAVRELDRALERATRRGTLLRVIIPFHNGAEYFYFVNTGKGRAAVEALQRGDWKPEADGLPVLLAPPRPNLFEVYEQNIGALTPMLADKLRDIEQTYPAAWFVEAVKIAVERNKRSLVYVESIIKRWSVEGKTSYGEQTGSKLSAAASEAGSGSGEPGPYERFWDAD